MVSKAALRKTGQAICHAVPPAQREVYAQAAAKIFTQHTSFKNAQHLACYLSFKDEFISSPVIEAIWQAKKKCYVPVIDTDKKRTLYFVRYEYGDALRLNRYSILEPVNVTRKITAQALDVVVMPLLGFDLQGHRLGTGGGYYDTTFAFLHEHAVKKPCMLGLAYAAQVMENVPHDTWDVLLNGVITEKNYIPLITSA